MDDLISRRALREAMCHEAMEVDSEEQRWDSGCWIRYKMFERVLESLPSAERKRGRWVRHILKNAKVPWGFDCSECGTWFVIGEDTAEGYNYCPNCGAEMRGEEG